MRKLFSILFVALLLFNALGYYGLFLGLKYHNDVEMMQKLDLGDYKESEMVTVKIPISIPYATDSEDFERVVGLFEYEGEFYRLVKQRLLRDTLHIVCVKDHDLAYINSAWTDYVKTFTDNQAENQTHSTAVYNFSKDYLPRTFSLIHVSSGWEYELTRHTHANFLTSEFHPSIIHPPERIT